MRDRKRNRLKGYDYSKDALYYITSNVKNRIHYFGHVRNGIMILNKFGQIANNQWYWLAEQYTYVVLHEFVVMPNHIHGLIEISAAGTGRDLSLHQKAFKIKSLSQLIGAYKTTVSKQIHLLCGRDFLWHRSLHDLSVTYPHHRDLSIQDLKAKKRKGRDLSL